MVNGNDEVHADHPLVGTWITESEDSDVAFTISVRDGAFAVEGFCRIDGEAFEISELEWDGAALTFRARMPSTDTVTKNRFRIRADGGADLECTSYEIWKKQDVPIGERPRGWDVKL